MSSAPLRQAAAAMVWAVLLASLAMSADGSERTRPGILQEEMSVSERQPQAMRPLRTENVIFACSYTRVPIRSAGRRSGVNWMRLNSSEESSANVFTVSVFASPGTPSRST